MRFIATTKLGLESVTAFQLKRWIYPTCRTRTPT